MQDQHIETLIQKEKEAQEKLNQAQAAYKEESLQVRVQLGALFVAERERAGISRQQMAVMLNTNRQCIFAAEFPERVPNPFSVDNMVRLLLDARKVAALFQSDDFKPSRRGRFKKTKTQNHEQGTPTHKS